MQTVAPTSPEARSDAELPVAVIKNRRAYQVVAETTYGRVTRYIKAVNHRQAAAIMRGSLKKASPVIKSVIPA